jgi:hypothetical protein
MSLTMVGQKVELRSEIEIAAPIALVWDVITDLPAYNQWNPFIVEADGEMIQGAVVATTVNFPGNRERTFRRRVSKLAPRAELRWSWTALLRAMAHSEQFFQLRESTDNRTRLVVGENLTGLLVPHTQRDLSQVSQGLTLMCQAIKRRAEALRSRPAEG